MNWEHVTYGTYRLKVHGGWLVKVGSQDSRSAAMTFVPDPEHVWDKETGE